MYLADPAATEAAGRVLGAVLREGDVVLLAGDLGAGKTSFARGVLAALGLEGEVASPTFPIVLTYDPPEVRLPLWHVDLYRIEDPEELEELGLDEATDGGALLIEWPDRLGSRAWPGALELSIEPEGEGRRLTWAPAPAWEGRWPSK